VPLRTFLSRLIWLCVLPLLLLAAFLAFQHVRSLQRYGARQARDLVQNVATAIDWHLSARIAALQMLAASPLLDDPDRWDQLYQEAQGYRQSFGSHVLLADTTMQMRFNTRVPYGEALPRLPTPKGHAAAPEALATGQPAVGDMVLSTVAKEPLVAVVVPVVRENRTRFLLLSSMEPKQFQQRLDQVSLPEGWVLILRDSQQEVIAQRLAPGMTAVPDLPAGAQGHLSVPCTVAPWSVTLDVPAGLYGAPVMTATLVLATAILMVTLISVLGARLAGRRLGRAVESLLHGPAHPPKGPRIAEIEAVSRTLARAAAAREKAEAAHLEVENAMRHQALLLREMGRIAKIGGWEFDPATGRGTWTEEVARIHDLDPADETSLNRGLSFYAGDSRTRIEAALREALERAVPYDLELELISATGARKWVRTIGHPTVENGKVVRVGGSFQEITDLKRAEQALAQSETLFRSLFQDHAAVKLILESDTGRIIDANRAAAAFYGWPRERLRQMRIQEINTLSEAEIGAEIEKVLAQKRIFFEFRHRRADGSIRDVEVFSSKIITGDKILIHSIVHDVTDRMEARRSLWESEHKYRIIIENSRDIIFTLDAEGRFLFVSPAMHYLLGYEPSALVGRPFQAIIHPDDTEVCIQAMRRIIENGTPSPGFEYRVRHTDGQWRWHTANGAAVHDAAGNLLHFQGVARDITERRKLEEQLRQSQKMESVGRLAGGVAHDYNNMLTVILGYTEMALSRTAADDPLHADLQEIQHAATRSADITRQLLAFARRQTIAPEVLDLNADVEKLLKMLRRLIGEDIDLAWLPGAGLWSVRMDPSQLNQVLANLCVNARDAIADVGKITIETRNVTFDEAYCANHPGFTPGNFVQLAVSDNGSGMDQEIQAHLFEPFFTTKGIGRGTGLGLATVYGIVKQNEGFINVYSEPGKGSSFRIYLPRHAGPALGAPKAKDDETPQGRGEMVLVVEDEEAILKLTQKILERLGYRVMTAGAPAEAIDLAGRPGTHIQLLITDVVMPGMNGRELADRLRQMHPGLNCLFMSGYTANAIAHHGMLDQDVRFIQKPFSASDLARKVQQALE
jgi:PAS domain S-box-containing protein